tara:strand:+ start:117 stop:392 length:276 start_codon:yes stop_codon:yes gene_type:complete
MVKKTDDSRPDPVRYLVTLQAINHMTPMDKLPQRFNIVAGGCGISVLDMQPMEPGEVIPKDVALAMLDALEESITDALFSGDMEGLDVEST